MSEARKGLKGLAIGCAAIAAAALAVLVLIVYQADKQLETKLATLRADGEPISIADLAPKRMLASAANAVTYLRRAVPDLDAIDSEETAVEEKLSIAEQKDFEALVVSKGMKASLRTILAAHAGAFPLIDEASHCREYDAGLNYHLAANDLLDALLKEIGLWRQACRVLQYRALVQLADGQRDEAMETCLTMFRLAESFESPFMVSQLVSLAMKETAAGTANLVLRSGPLSEAAYAGLARQLDADSPTAHFHQAMRSERAFMLESWNSALAGSFAPLLERMPWRKHDLCDYLDLISVAIDTDPLPRQAWRDAVAAASVPGRVGPTTEVMRGSLEPFHDAVLRTVARLRALQVLNALISREHGGPSGGTLDDLDLSADAKTDPFTDQPLVVKRLPEGWLIYTVGDDLKDGGGDLDGNHDVGVGPLPPAKAGGGTSSDEAAAP